MSKFSIDRRALLVTGVSSVALAACSNIIGPPDASPLYMLKPPKMAAGGGPRVFWQLSVTMPEAPDSLDTDRIALVQPTSQMDYYAGATWQDQLPSLVQSSLIEAFEASGRIAAVGRDTEGLKADFVLLTDIRDFQARYDVADAPPTAVVRIVARMMAVRGRTIVQTINAHGEVAAGENSVASVVVAFDQALGNAVSQIVDGALAAPAPERTAG
jgi:cholesterol transport system auxiliary component